MRHVKNVVKYRDAIHQVSHNFIEMRHVKNVVKYRDAIHQVSCRWRTPYDIIIAF